MESFKTGNDSLRMAAQCRYCGSTVCLGYLVGVCMFEIKFMVGADMLGLLVASLQLLHLPSFHQHVT